MKIYGKNPALERLRANPKSIRKIYLQEEFKEASLFRQKAQQHRIPVVTVPKSKILKMGRNINSQGVIVDVEGFDYVEFSDLLDQARKKRRTIIFMDEVKDPQNFGAILRTVACLGRFSIVLPAHDSVGVTETVLKIACGADNYVPMAQVNNLNNAIKKAQELGYYVIGSVVGEGASIMETELTFPLGLVVGSEEKGIRPIIKKQLDALVTVPMSIHTLSLNVAHATSILCYEITRQQKTKNNAAV